MNIEHVTPEELLVKATMALPTALCILLADSMQPGSVAGIGTGLM
jgi:hypothetical protein